MAYSTHHSQRVMSANFDCRLGYHCTWTSIQTLKILFLKVKISKWWIIIFHFFPHKNLLEFKLELSTDWVLGMWAKKVSRWDGKERRRRKLRQFSRPIIGTCWQIRKWEGLYVNGLSRSSAPCFLYKLHRIGPFWALQDGLNVLHSPLDFYTFAAQLHVSKITKAHQLRASLPAMDPEKSWTNPWPVRK